MKKFRGDATLFDDGIQWIEEQTGLPVLGLIPYYRHIEIDSEDGMPLETVLDPPTRPIEGKINLAALRFPHISNFTDFNPLIRQDGVRFHYLSKPRALTGYDTLFLPGSKNVRFDLQWLRDTGWEPRLQDFARAGGRIFGICGGYQMLGQTLTDPDGVEGRPGTDPGLGLLDVQTVLRPEKVLSRSQGIWMSAKTPVDGYEIHMGETRRGPAANPLIRVQHRNRIAVEPHDAHDGPSTRPGVFAAPIFTGSLIRSRSETASCNRWTLILSSKMHRPQPHSNNSSMTCWRTTLNNTLTWAA